MRPTLQAICVPLLLFFLCISPGALAGQSKPEKPEKVTVCDLLDHREQWNRKLIEVTGFASHGFEDSGFADPACGDRLGLWMEYGGKLRTGTMSTVSNSTRTSVKPMTVEGINVTLVEDATFRRFDEFLHRSNSGNVHATVIARFFAGKLQKYPVGEIWGGYGHLGCCSLFVIQKVLEVDDHLRPGLDYGNDPDQPETYPHQDLVLASTRAANLRDQRSAEEGDRAYAFTNPERVAREAIPLYARAPKVDPESLVITRKSGNAFRAVYMAAERNSHRRFMVVVNRPYWLSYSAKESTRVPWVIMAAYELEDTEGAK